jgi:hypothetical protein
LQWQRLLQKIADGTISCVKLPEIRKTQNRTGRVTMLVASKLAAADWYTCFAVFAALGYGAVHCIMGR